MRAQDDPEDAHELWRIERDDLMARHPATPLLEPRSRCCSKGCRSRRTTRPGGSSCRSSRPSRADSSSRPATDGIVPFERIGLVEIPDAGTLDVWRLTTYGGGLFVPVRDALAGQPGGTYGGGRYLIDTIKGADLGSDAAGGTMVLDFNFAYNPSCAYDPAWACPLAQPGNVLPIAVPVGELYG